MSPAIMWCINIIALACRYVVVYFSYFIGWNRWRSSCNSAREGGYATHVDENWLEVLCKVVKADNTAIALMDSSFAEAVEFLFIAFYIFAVDYPYILRLLNDFLERILKIDSSVKSSVLTDLLRKFTHLAQSQNTDWWRANGHWPCIRISTGFHLLFVYSQQFWQCFLYINAFE